MKNQRPYNEETGRSTRVFGKGEVDIPFNLNEATITDINNEGIRMMLKRAFLRGVAEGKALNVDHLGPEVEMVAQEARCDALQGVVLLIANASAKSREELTREIGSMATKARGCLREMYTQIENKLHEQATKV